MTVVVAEKELYRACEVIFGPELDISREFLEYLQLAGVKSAYRKRAMETHPDRAAVESLVLAQPSVEPFHNVQQAYENLVNYLKARENGFRLLSTATAADWRQRHAWTRPQPRPRPAKPAAEPGRERPQARRAQPRPKARQEAGRDRSGPFATFWKVEEFYSGSLPDRRLLLGHFLYYSGVVTWRSIVQALIWQRTNRPRLGEMGRRFGMLSEEQIRTVLRRKELLQPFGASALALGLLTDRELGFLIQAQKRAQKKIGEYFVENQLLTIEQLACLVRQYHEHNARLVGACNYGRGRR